jgi:hypothetical protein
MRILLRTTRSKSTDNNSLIPWRRVLLEKLMVAQLIKKCMAFYGTVGTSSCSQDLSTITGSLVTTAWPVHALLMEGTASIFGG